jgi:hypothetical protein
MIRNKKIFQNMIDWLKRLPLLICWTHPTQVFYQVRLHPEEDASLEEQQETPSIILEHRS